MFTHLLNQTITLKVTNGTDENSAPIISSTKTGVKCRIDWKNSLVTTSQSRQITSKASILFEEETAKIGDIVTINSIDYTVIQASPKYDFDANFIINEILI
jgi:hypothetical protein